MADDLTLVDEPFDPVTGEMLPAARDWQIHGLEDLDWALARLGTLEAQAKQNEALEAKAVARFQAHVAKLNERLERGAAYFRGLIAAYANENRADLLGNGKKKSRELPHGVVGWRNTRSALEVIDRDALWDWALDHDCTTMELDMKAVRERATRDDVPPPGTRWTEAGETLQIKPASEALAMKEDDHE